jgi:hypothetical protein
MKVKTNQLSLESARSGTHIQKDGTELQSKYEKCETISIPRSLPSFHNVCPYFCSTMETNFFRQKTKENLS